MGRDKMKTSREDVLSSQPPQEGYAVQLNLERSWFSKRGEGQRERMGHAWGSKARLQAKGLGYLPGAVRELSGSESIPGY